jgi:hypothetical protein
MEAKMSDPRSPIQPHQFTLISNNMLGHPRYVLHHGNLLTPWEHRIRNIGLQEATLPEIIRVNERFYQIAIKRANAIGGRKYDTKSYRQGIVFVSFNLDETIQYIEEVLTNAINFQQSAI